MLTLTLTQKQRVRRSFGALIGVAVSLYFGAHAISGDRGLLAYRTVVTEHAIAQQKLVDVQGEAHALRQRISGLREASLDRDLLDEQAREVLHFGQAGEFVILLPSS